jgi:tetratricopeptide (TPR) repeat protein
LTKPTFQARVECYFGHVQRVRFLAAASVFTLVVLLYFPTLRGGFVYDSIAQVLYSDYIHNPANWGDLLTLRVVGQDELDRNRPLHLASLMLDAAIWKKEPFGYRLTSVLLHALNAALLFLFLTIALRPRTTPVAAASSPPVVALFAAVFGALLFALHPLVVEAVAEPSNREDLLVLLPMLLGLLAVAAPIRSPWVLNTALVLCSFSAVLAKESGIAVPMVFAVAAWWCGSFPRLLPGLVGGLVAATGFLVASYLWRPTASAIFAQTPGPLAADLWSLLSVQSRIWTLQFWQIMWPWNLSAHYTAEAIAGITLPVAMTALAGVALAAVFAWRADRLSAFGVAVYVLCLLPASNFAAQYHPIADRYLYVPLAGLGMIAAALVYRLRAKYPRGFVGFVIIVTVFLLLCLEYAANLRRQFIWQQPATLWSDVLLQYPNTSQTRIGIANAHYRAGDFQAARAAATEAVVSSGGDWADAWALRAVSEWQTGDREQALASFARARSLSRVYANMDTIEKALIFSPEQLQVISEIISSER